MSAARQRRTAGCAAVLDEAQLVAWGERIGAAVTVPVVLALRGELGAGKSVLARAIARGAGVSGPMPSPTFNLLFRYRGSRGVEVVHLDLFRLEQPEDVFELGWQDLGEDEELVMVEWPERAEELLPACRWDIRLESAGELHRRVSAVPCAEPPSLPALPEAGRIE